MITVAFSEAEVLAETMTIDLDSSDLDDEGPKYTDSEDGDGEDCCCNEQFVRTRMKAKIP